MSYPSPKLLLSNHFTESVQNNTLVTFVVFLTSLKRYLGLLELCVLRHSPLQFLRKFVVISHCLEVDVETLQILKWKRKVLKKPTANKEN